MSLLDENYFYSTSEDKVNIVSLTEDDDEITTIDGVAAKLFLILVEGEESQIEQLRIQYKIEEETFNKFHEELIKSLSKLGIFKQ